MNPDEPIDMVDFKVRKATGLTQEQLYEIRNLASVAQRLVWCSVLLFVGMVGIFIYWVV